jgi:hypothetical protein
MQGVQSGLSPWLLRLLGGDQVARLGKGGQNMKPLVVTFKGDLIANESLGELQTIINRNRSRDCDLPLGTLTRHVIQTALIQLRDNNVFIGTFADGSKVHFIGRLPFCVNANSVSEMLTAKGY